MIMAEDCRSLSPNFADIDLDGSFDDILDLGEIGDSDASSPYRYGHSNAVHMEIQNNAMLPTFNLNVDRRNSSSVPRTTSVQPYSPTTRREIEEMMRLSENDFSLTEVFLKSSDRTSQNMNYSTAGAAMGAVTAKMGDRRNDVASTVNQPEESSNPVSASTLQNHLRYYRRPIQLPIPILAAPVPAPEPKVWGPVMDDAVAIAAAIVSQATNPDSLPDSVTAMDVKPQGGASTTAETTATTNANVSLPAVTPTLVPEAASAPQSYPYPPPRSATTHPSAAYPYSRLNASAAAPTPQIVAATMQRSQFGFGGDHQVPCVPNPPKRAVASNKKKKGKASSSLTSAATSPPTPPVVNAGPAYERKKQRAKDARLKLNDSIERMSIAMSLAGTQSQQRAAVHADPQTRKVMLECAETAESAKKWDRPGFVGTAATLIQHLNSQCEALVRELNRQAGGVTSINGIHKRADTVDGDDEQDVTGATNKRRKVDPNADRSDVNLVWSHPKLLQCTASYLDPQSLSRCQCLTQQLRKSFSQDDIWLDRCIQRFGLFHVRQWKEKLNDNDDDDGDSSLSPSPSSQHLYRQMDAHNVKPLQSPLLVLAEARMPNKVSAWVTMVERSNGETSRSVRQSDGRYTSVPVVELRMLIQNTGSSEPIAIKDQIIVVDASTRRRGEEWKELSGDARFRKRLFDLQEAPCVSRHDDELARLRLFESVVLVVHIHCKGCSTSSKFQQRANFTKILVQLNGTTVPLVIPFFRESQLERIEDKANI